VAAMAAARINNFLKENSQILERVMRASQDNVGRAFSGAGGLVASSVKQWGV